MRKQERMTEAKLVADPEQRLAQFEEELRSLSPAQLLLKLYDVAIASCDHEEGERLVCAMTELIAALNFDHREISMTLFRIYDHCIRLGQAGHFEAVRAILVQLRDTWSESAGALESSGSSPN